LVAYELQTEKEIPGSNDFEMLLKVSEMEIFG